MKKVLLAVLGGAAALVSSVSQAAIDVTTHLTPIGTEISGDITTVFTWIMPIIGTMIAIMVGVKLLKKLSSKV